MKLKPTGWLTSKLDHGKKTVDAEVRGSGVGKHWWDLSFGNNG